MAVSAFDNMLMLSGIQHIAFCERQWALIHIEQQWTENVLTVEGQQLHKRVNDPFDSTSSAHSVVLRSLPLISYQLGLKGIADVVEFQATDLVQNSTILPAKKGFWKPVPIEYKRGKPKPDERDEVQLCAQAMCIEEMYSVKIVSGYLFYGETRHRHEVEFTDLLRETVVGYAKQMHSLFNNAKTPLPIYKPHCRSCSLFDICLPVKLSKYEQASDYLNEMLSTENN